MSTTTELHGAGGAGTGAANPARPPKERSGIPPLLLAPAGIGLVFLIIPLVGLMIRAPWTELPDELSKPLIHDALLRSLYTASMATVVALFLGIPIAVASTPTDGPDCVLTGGVASAGDEVTRSSPAAAAGASGAGSSRTAGSAAGAWCARW